MTLSSAQSANPLWVEVRGKGFPILCLHGHPGNGRSLSVFTDRLCQRFQTLAPDLRGYGKSQTRQEFRMQDHLLDLEALLDRFNISQCLVLGWSLGGILAMELALRQPQRVAGLILIATAARPWGNHPPISWQDNVYTGIASILNWLRPDWEWNRETFGKRSLYRYLIAQHSPTAYRYLAAAAAPAYLQTSAAARKALGMALADGYNRLADISKIQCPSLMLAGAADRHITAESSRETSLHLPNCQWHCYADTAHLFPWEIPDRAIADIEIWLEKHPLAGSLF